MIELVSEMSILKGKPVAESLEDLASISVTTLYPTSKPKLAIIKVGDDPASESYIRSKLNACERVGIKCVVLRYADTITQSDLMTIISNLNKAKDTNGIIVQLPLPGHLNEREIANAIDPIKDVDCFTDVNLGKFYSGEKDSIVPCTPLGVINLLRHYQIPIESRKVVIVGRSLIAGKPMAELILRNNGVPVILHSLTPYDIYLRELRSADIIISATGRPKSITRDTLTGESFKNPVCIDIGISRVDGKLLGDFDFESLKDITPITPVPGGTGLTTVSSLILNTLRCKVLQDELEV